MPALPKINKMILGLCPATVSENVQGAVIVSYKNIFGIFPFDTDYVFHIHFCIKSGNIV